MMKNIIWTHIFKVTEGAETQLLALIKCMDGFCLKYLHSTDTRKVPYYITKFLNLSPNLEMVYNIFCFVCISKEHESQNISDYY